MLTYRLNGPVLTDYELELCDLDSSIVKNYITANDVHNILSHANGEDVTFNVNSAGGSVFEASEIYTMLSTYKGKVVVNISLASNTEPPAELTLNVTSSPFAWLKILCTSFAVM